ncbi:MBL fold metallo-hydrolase [Kribbella sp. NPDC026611]|uniref:MBL fold metallo-hydrolase n=1 Tax=Kribbella sp. NPDC026611 TaxID=3154911 RepID=UPI0033EFA044
MTPLADPAVHVANVTEVASDVLVIPNDNGDLVPNIGIICGTDAVLVVDTGLGNANAVEVLDLAARVAGRRRIYLTTTHFHPEHAFGAQAFAGHATYLVNRAQAADLALKGSAYLTMFRGFGGAIAERLEDVEVPVPDVVYDDLHELDLGNRVVRLRPTGQGHTKGDQVIEVDGTLFTGDLAETDQFPIFPWFPPHDTDVSATGWLAVLERVVATAPALVVPGHGGISTSQLLVELADYLRDLLAQVDHRRASLEEIIAELRPLLIAQHPTWTGEEWIGPTIASMHSARARGANGSEGVAG